MRNILVILKHNLKSVMKGWFLLVLIFPICINIFIDVIMNKLDNNINNSNNNYNVAIYSEDKSEIIDNIFPKDEFNISYFGNKDEVRKSIKEGDISVGIIIESKDLYKDIKNNKSNSMEILSLESSNARAYVQSSIETSIMQISSLGDTKEEYIKKYKEYKNNKYEITYESEKLEEIFFYTAMFGIFSMGFLFIAGRCIIPLLTERQLKIDKRILISKVSKVEYNLGHILGGFILLLVQSITLVGVFSIMNPGFNISIGWMLLLSFALSFVGIAIALIALSISNNSSMYYTLLTMIVTPMCLLSGGFVPISFMPEIIRKFSVFLPLTWINSAFEKILLNKSFNLIGLDLLVSISISLVLIMLYLVIENNKKNKLGY